MNSRILAFNTVTDLCSVALKIDHNVYSVSVIAPKLHAEKILPMINKLLVDSGVTLRSLDCIVFDHGPGNFIGLRIGIGIAQGLSLGANLPLIGVSSLEILAQGAQRIFFFERVIATIDAGMNELYYACYSYNINSNTWVCENGVSLATIEVIQEIICVLDETWIVVGTGWNNHEELKSCIKNLDTVVLTQIMYPNAQDMLLLGMCAYKHKRFLTPDQVRPIYLKKKNRF